MKITDLAKNARPIFCRFDDIDDTCGGVIAKEPVWEEDNYNSGRDMLVVRLTGGGVPYELRARSQMIEAILAATIDANAKGLEPGGLLSVTFAEFRGKAKIYRATYEPPEDGAGSGAASRESIGTGRLEFGADDPDDGPEF